jgi:predicted SnoaL-like aldol condensation-catalyzing enzyme
LLQRLRASGPLPNEVKRIICDGDFVFTHVKYPGPVPIAGSDVFQFDEEGRICAHWNVRQPLGRSAGDIDEWFTAAPPAPVPMTFDRRQLKARVREMLDELWAKGDSSLVAKYYAESYVQHNPDMPGGFVFLHLSLFMAGINRNAGERSTNVDIFRVDQSGLMIEHWDVLQIQGEALPNSLTIF